MGTDYRLALGKSIELQPWLKISVRHEFADNNKVRINNSDYFNNDLSGTRGVYQAGLRTKITDNLMGHVGAGYGNGAGIQSPWRAEAGISWSF
ncbi:autotransporter outer membrane beta-barrel domain-containing protein [Citrobacter braakii]|nr:autotransporter outer membrane beta-barrel domain-containing protein [Citrobacter braakii]WIF78746.1 autotransporter outer membrane beta-barrel domain-containing protein [Citrobacter braakii]